MTTSPSARTRGDVVPLTFQQQWLWGAIPDKSRSRLAMVLARRLYGPLRVDFLKESLDTIIRRHGALRTRIVTIGGHPKQHVDEIDECDLETASIAGATDDVESEARRLAADFVYEPFDLTVGPLFKVKLLRLSDHDHVLALAMDHIVSDVVSMQIVLRELRILYVELAQGRPPSLPKVRLQYGDYALWQQRTSADWGKSHIAYWQERLSGATRIRFPVDAGITGIKPFSKVPMQVGLGKQVSAGLRELARNKKTTPARVVLALYVALLSRICNTRDLVVPFNTTGRHLPGYEDVIGYFPHILYLRIKLAGNDSFLDVLLRVDMELNSALRHDDLGQMINLVPELLEGAWFQWDPWVSYADDEAARRNSAPGELDAVSAKSFALPQPGLDADAIGIRIDLLFAFRDIGEEIVGKGNYRADLFKASTMDMFCRNLRRFAQQLLVDPTAPIAIVPICV